MLGRWWSGGAYLRGTEEILRLEPQQGGVLAEGGDLPEPRVVPALEVGERRLVDELGVLPAAICRVARGVAELAVCRLQLRRRVPDPRRHRLLPRRELIVYVALKRDDVDRAVGRAIEEARRRRRRVNVRRLHLHRARRRAAGRQDAAERAAGVVPKVVFCDAERRQAPRGVLFVDIERLPVERLHLRVLGQKRH